MQQTIRMEQNGEINRGEAEYMITKYSELWRSTMNAIEIKRQSTLALLREQHKNVAFYNVTGTA